MPPEDTNSLNSSASVRLQKLSYVPAHKELEFALKQARKTTSAVIELPWKTPSSLATFVLKVSFDELTDDARWVLHKGETLDAAVLWSFDSDDTTLIESLIVAECGAYQGEVGASPSESGAYQFGIAGDGAGAGSDDLNLMAPAVSSRNLPPPAQLSVDLVTSFRDKLKDEKMGCFSADSFLFFLFNEFERYKNLGQPMAIIVFDLKANYGDGNLKPLPERALAEAFRRFEQVLRSVDVLGLFLENGFAILLPGASANQSVDCAKVLERSLAQGPLQPGLDVSNVQFSAGAASIPDTCNDLAVLVAAAQEALRQSLEARTSLVLFPSS
ncbi:MAG: diguanylate cyclase [Candidatus Obscuribacterales bacterium]|nr:diguanylate cyclase [Candidatus Obscuribacterales bacterium]